MTQQIGNESYLTQLLHLDIIVDNHPILSFNGNDMIASLISIEISSVNRRRENRRRRRQRRTQRIQEQRLHQQHRIEEQRRLNR